MIIRNKYLFSPRPVTVTGLDLGAHTIRLLQLSRHNGFYQVEHYREVVLTTAVDNIQIALSHLLTGNKSLENVIIALPDAAIMTHLIQVDASLTVEQIEAHILLESERYVPFPLEEMYFDFHVMDNTDEKGAQQNVLLVACQKEKIATQIGILAKHNITVSVIDVASFACERAARSLFVNTDDSVSALVNIGMTNLLLLVFKREKVIYSNNFWLTANNTDQEQSWEHIAETVKQALQMFSSQYPVYTPSQLLLAGGGALLGGLIAYLSATLQFPVALANPLGHMTFGHTVNGKELQTISPSLLQVCGLALHDLQRKY